MIDPSGRNIFFITSQGLVPQDTDGADDVYDARLGGGFPLPPAPVQPCAGDACQGPLTNPAPLLVPGSAVRRRVKVLAPLHDASTASTKKKPHKKTRAKKRKPKRKARHSTRAKHAASARRTGRSGR